MAQLFTGRWLLAHIAAVGLQYPGVGVITQVVAQLPSDAAYPFWLFQRKTGLNTLVQVAFHPVGAGQEQLLCTASIEEVVHPAVLQLTTDNRAYLDVF